MNRATDDLVYLIRAATKDYENATTDKGRADAAALLDDLARRWIEHRRYN